MYRIKQLSLKEIPKYYELKVMVDYQSAFWPVPYSERESYKDIEMLHYTDILSKGNSSVLVAADGGAFVGYLECRGGKYSADKHVGELELGLLDGYHGVGLGSLMMDKLEAWLEGQGFRVIYAKVISPNKSAVKLLEKYGYTLEATLRERVAIHGRYYDEFTYVKVYNR